jgi:hypothetical protein
MPECFTPTGRGPMKMPGFEPRFSQNLAPVRAKQNPKTLTSSIFHIYSADPIYESILSIKSKKVLKKLRKYTKSRYAKNVSLYFQSLMKTSLDTLKVET